jgi:hypothetical protein
MNIISIGKDFQLLLLWKKLSINFRYYGYNGWQMILSIRPFKRHYTLINKWV